MRAVGAARDAVRGVHQRAVSVGLWTYAGGFDCAVPISDGRLEWSLSRADGVRSGRLTVPGYEWFPTLDPSRGSWVTVDVSIGRETWELGEFPVVGATVVRPRGTVEVVLGDWAWRRARPVETAVTVGGSLPTLAVLFAFYMRQVVPGGAFTVTRDDSGGAVVQSPVEVPVGGSVWRAIVEQCNQAGCVPVVTSRASGEIRRYEQGPAVASVDGCIVEETTVVDVEAAANRVVVQGESSDPETGTTVFRAVRTLTAGPYQFDRDGIGELPLVETFRQPVVTQALVDAEADRVFERRAGAVRSQDLQVVPMPWLEVGDTVSWVPVWDRGRLRGVIDALTLPLTARGVQSLTMRDATIRNNEVA